MQSSCKRDFVVYAKARDLQSLQKAIFWTLEIIIRSHNNPQDGEQANHQSKAT
jgi:hypothetical protein